MAVKKASTPKPAKGKAAEKISGKTPIPKNVKKPSPPPAPPPKGKKTTAKTTPARSNGKHPGGRPTKYNSEFHPALVKALGEQGKTVTEICADMKISTSTFVLWQQNHPEFSIAIKDAREKADEIVEQSLYRMAKGYEHEVEKPMVVGDGLGESHVEIVKYTERLAPNTTAMIFWLKNRKPKDWRDKQEMEHSGNVTVKIDADDAEL